MTAVDELFARARAAGVAIRRNRRGRLEITLPPGCAPQLALQLHANRSALEQHEREAFRLRVAVASTMPATTTAATPARWR